MFSSAVLCTSGGPNTVLNSAAMFALNLVTDFWTW
jgi:hypothetical protein